jgi:hypothetical protein
MITRVITNIDVSAGPCFFDLLDYDARSLLLPRRDCDSGSYSEPLADDYSFVLRDYLSEDIIINLFYY